MHYVYKNIWLLKQCLWRRATKLQGSGLGTHSVDIKPNIKQLVPKKTKKCLDSSRLVVYFTFFSGKNGVFELDQSPGSASDSSVVLEVSR